jgi:hypothetical protein
VLAVLAVSKLGLAEVCIVFPTLRQRQHRALIFEIVFMLWFQLFPSRLEATLRILSANGSSKAASGCRKQRQ